MRRFTPPHGQPAQLVALALLAVAGLAACDLEAPTATNGSAPELSLTGEVEPSPLVPVAFGTGALTLWPYTGTDVAGTTSDPINLLFPGRDVRDVRAALLTLDGNRTAFGMPPVAPFDCVWDDAIGANQTSYTAEHGWQGSAIQLECGGYEPMRFHVRLFRAGDGAIANAHFEVIIPGTNQHEVLSWELAEQMITVDMIRTGLLDPAAPLGLTAEINSAPTFKAINPLIYNGLPVALRAVIGGPLANQAAPVPMPSNGRATVVNLTAAPESERSVERFEYTLQFNQIIPKPFCSSGPFDYLRVVGPVEFAQHVVVSSSGNYLSHFRARGTLSLTPVNPLTGQPIGDSYEARVRANYRNLATENATFASNVDMQVMLANDGPFTGRLVSRLRVGPGVSDVASIDIRCE